MEISNRDQCSAGNTDEREATGCADDRVGDQQQLAGDEHDGLEPRPVSPCWTEQIAQGQGTAGAGIEAEQARHRPKTTVLSNDFAFWRRGVRGQQSG
jgi:hypothetical protein